MTLLFICLAYIIVFFWLPVTNVQKKRWNTPKCMNNSHSLILCMPLFSSSDISSPSTICPPPTSAFLHMSHLPLGCLTSYVKFPWWCLTTICSSETVNMKPSYFRLYPVHLLSRLLETTVTESHKQQTHTYTYTQKKEETESETHIIILSATITYGNFM